jgi:hypothetical protein
LKFAGQAAGVVPVTAYAARALEGGKRGEGDPSRPLPPLRTLAATAAAATAHPPLRAGAVEVSAAKEEDALRRCCEQLRVQCEQPSQIEGSTLKQARALKHRAV